MEKYNYTNNNNNPINELFKSNNKQIDKSNEKGKGKRKDIPLSKREKMPKDLLNSPTSTDSLSPLSIHSKNFVAKEYPNMVLSSSKKEQLPKIEKTEKKEKMEKNGKIIKNIKSLCKVGTAGPNQKKLNQDNYFIFQNFLNNPSYAYIGVCDGHGIFGQNVSCYLKDHLSKNIQEEFLHKKITNLAQSDIILLSQTINNIYQKTNKEMNEDERIDSTYSGSTCVSIIFSPERLFCINVGDSRCVLGKFNSNKNEWIAMNLSRDHKPSEPNEKERILKNEGKVEPYVDNEGNFIGPERVWLKNGDGPGLAMSRSFGDEVAHTVGVIVNPEIFDYHFVEEDKFIIIASDGIWEFISSEEVVEITKNFYLKNDLEGALDYLYNESVKRWMINENIIDDITIVLLFLE